MHSLSSSRIIEYNSKNSLKVGAGLPVRVNASIGLAKSSSYHLEKEKYKIIKLLERTNKPDLFMDLSICNYHKELWAFLLDVFEGPVGAIPHYLAFDDKRGLDKTLLLERIHNLAESGISFITVHATPNTDLINAAISSRGLPVTSRGGNIILKDMCINSRKNSLYAELFEDICAIALKHNVVINLGTTFRSASVVDGLDAPFCAEVKAQRYFIDRALNIGVKIVLEGPGHLSMSSIDKYIRITKGYNVPLMPLGPIITDSYPGLDQYSSAIGAAYMMYKAKGGIINSVTSIEHKGGLPTAKHLFEAVDAATVAAHSASLTYNKQSYEKEKTIRRIRAMNKSCLTSPTKGNGCARCSDLCPLVQI